MHLTGQFRRPRLACTQRATPQINTIYLSVGQCTYLSIYPSYIGLFVCLCIYLSVYHVATRVSHGSILTPTARLQPKSNAVEG